MTARIVMDSGGGPVVGSLVLPASEVDTPVTASNLDNTGVEGWRWAIIDAPAPSPTLNPLPAPTFLNTDVITPDVKGHSIMLHLTTYSDAARTIIDDTDQKVLGVRFDPPFDWLIPAAGETLEIDLIRGWATDVNRILREVHAVIEGTGIAGFGAFKEVVAGDLVTVPSKIQINVDGRVRMNGHLVLNGHMRQIGRVPIPQKLFVGEAQEIPNNSRVRLDPTGGPYTLLLNPKGSPGEEVELVSVSDAIGPPAITIDGQGPLLGGVATRQITSAREYLRLRREKGHGWAVI